MNLRPDGPFEGRIVRVEPLEERHREGLREAAEAEPHIHRYTNLYSFGFDRWFDLALASETDVPFVVCVDGRPAGSLMKVTAADGHVYGPQAGK